ncbi:hypothetical protein NW762_001335 [Fusarium torreyae]|uniref:Uncharacterized protein n=1 Tax=Fusarium torreyae TaxID=1237075 RepID=A0A9W8SCB0_9HYPO|nr:hypothetical protein NW762_001335 [Fusarium torreyae]
MSSYYDHENNRRPSGFLSTRRTCTLAITISKPPTGSHYQWGFTIRYERSEDWRTFEAVQLVQDGPWRLSVHENNPSADPNYFTAVFIRRINISFLFFIHRLCAEIPLPRVLAVNRLYTSQTFVDDVLNSLLRNDVIDGSIWDDVKDSLAVLRRIEE